MTIQDLGEKLKKQCYTKLVKVATRQSTKLYGGIYRDFTIFCILKNS